MLDVLLCILCVCVLCYILKNIFVNEPAVCMVQLYIIIPTSFISLLVLVTLGVLIKCK